MISFMKGKVKNNDIIQLDKEDTNFDFDSGTEVELSKIDTSKYKFSNIDEKKIKESIELHCENILREKDINIYISF